MRKSLKQVVVQLFSIFSFSLNRYRKRLFQTTFRLFLEGRLTFPENKPPLEEKSEKTTHTQTSKAFNNLLQPLFSSVQPFLSPGARNLDLFWTCFKHVTGCHQDFFKTWFLFFF